jgi:DNA-binding NarL/FixJ family response regulator
VPWLFLARREKQRFFSSLVGEPHESQWAAIHEARSMSPRSLSEAIMSEHADSADPSTSAPGLADTHDAPVELIRVLLADDHVMVREGTRRILEREADLKVVAEAGNGRETVALVQQLHPDVALVDISMPVMNGIEATRGIKRVAPQTAVLILTAYEDDEYVFAVLEAGAAGYLLKNARSSELIDAVRKVYQGESVLHPAIAKKVLLRVRESSIASSEAPTETLTDREVVVLKLAARGLSNRQIAAELVLSPRTVQAHLANIFGKLQVASRTEAVTVGLRKRWISLQDLNGEQGRDAEH